jgi:anti-sigma factor RsiW
VTCHKINDLLSPYADGELDLVRDLEFERHLEACPVCAAALEWTRSLSARLSDQALYHQPPADLHRRVRTSLARANGARLRTVFLPWRWLGTIAAAAALVALALWGATRASWPRSAEEHVAREVVAGHVRSLMANHLLDVESSDQDTIKPWFFGKVDFVPEVKDLAGQGFRLAGGRLDYIDNRPAAALVYLRDKHVINVFTWRAAGDDATLEYLERQGYHLICYADNDRTYWVVSDLNEQELRAFTELLRQ